MSKSPSESEFWQSRYENQQTGWDLGSPAPAWERLCELHDVPRGRTLVVGAGRGHDALWWARRGNAVTAVDFAAGAVQATRASAATAGLPIDVQQQDLFKLSPEGFGLFDVVVEHTCFCAIEPARRGEYVDVISRMLRPGGLLLAVFFWQLPPGGPPFATSAGEVRALFGESFEMLRLEPNPSSVPGRQGKEGWGVLRRRESSRSIG